MKNAPSAILKMFGIAAIVAIAPATWAQNLPAGVGGYWKITRMLPKKPMATPDCTANPAFFSKMARGSRVLMSDRNIVWGGASATDPAARVSTVDPGDFSAHHAQAGATLHDLELDRSSKIEVIHLGSPGNLPFDTIIVKDPSTLYFEHCGIFMEAVHDSGFVAPPLPNGQH
ncbi:MAG TPA: hypothetical protein VGM02_08720 [Acidobacteriaceae bacterium]|jgi:hypothetical protein